MRNTFICCTLFTSRCRNIFIDIFSVHDCCTFPWTFDSCCVPYAIFSILLAIVVRNDDPSKCWLALGRSEQHSTEHEETLAHNGTEWDGKYVAYSTSAKSVTWLNAVDGDHNEFSMAQNAARRHLSMQTRNKVETFFGGECARASAVRHNMLEVIISTVDTLEETWTIKLNPFSWTLSTM